MNKGWNSVKRFFVPEALGGGNPSNDGMALVFDSTQDSGVRTSQAVSAQPALTVKPFVPGGGGVVAFQVLSTTGAVAASITAGGTVVSALGFQCTGTSSVFTALKGAVAGAIVVTLDNGTEACLIGSVNTARVVQTIRGLAAQTGDLTQWQASTAIPLARITAIGKGCFSELANGAQGIVSLVAGTATVSNTNVTASSRIFLTVQSLSGIAAPVGVSVTARTAGTSFTITSASALDTSSVAYVIFEPA